MDSERCYADDPGGVAETVALLAETGAAGCSIEDYDPAAGGIDDVDGRRARRRSPPRRPTGSPSRWCSRRGAENHLHGVADLDDTIARLVAYRDAGADAVYAPG